MGFCWKCWWVCWKFLGEGCFLRRACCRGARWWVLLLLWSILLCSWEAGALVYYVRAAGVGLGWEEIIDALEGSVCALDFLPCVRLELLDSCCVCVGRCLDIWLFGGCVAWGGRGCAWFDREGVWAFAGGVVSIERVRY